MSSANLLGIDVGGTKSSVLIGSAKGDVLDRIDFPSHAQRGPVPMIQDILAAAKTLRSRHSGAISGVGVSIGGPLDYRQGIIHNPPNLPGWDGTPLKAMLEEGLHLPVRVMHDAAACALAEYRWGAGQDCTRLAYLTCGTGLGVGLIFDGKPYTGAQGYFPEVGHCRLEKDGPVAFGKAGSVEAFCSGTGLSLTAQWLYPERWKTNPPKGAELSKLAQQGDADAKAVLDRAAGSLGQVCANLCDLLILDRIVIGSLGMYLGPVWMDQVRSAFQSEALPFIAQHCKIEVAQLGERLQTCSALAAALP